MKPKTTDGPEFSEPEFRLLKQLRQHPELRERFQSLLDLAQAAEGPLKTASPPYLGRGTSPQQWLVCPAGGTYTIGSTSEAPTCSVPGHELLMSWRDRLHSVVAQNGILLYRRIAFGRPPNAPQRARSTQRQAGCKPAIRQNAMLRYEAATNL